MTFLRSNRARRRASLTRNHTHTQLGWASSESAEVILSFSLFFLPFLFASVTKQDGRVALGLPRGKQLKPIPFYCPSGEIERQERHPWMMSNRLISYYLPYHSCSSNFTLIFTWMSQEFLNAPSLAIFCVNFSYRSFVGREKWRGRRSNRLFFFRESSRRKWAKGTELSFVESGRLSMWKRLIAK